MCRRLIFVLTSLYLVLWESGSVRTPDLQWSFEQTCSEQCEICIGSVRPGDGKYKLKGGCTNNSSTRTDDLVAGFIGDGLQILAEEAAVANTSESCITDLSKKIPLPGSSTTLTELCIGLTVSFWISLHNFPSSRTRRFIIRTATFGDTSDLPSTTGIGISVSNDRRIWGQVQTTGVNYEVKTSDNAVILQEWTHVILSWSQAPLNIILNGSTSAFQTKTYDLRKPEKPVKSIVIGDRKGELNFTIDEIKIWFGKENNDEIFREAVSPPTVPPTTTAEGPTRPYYTYEENPKLEDVSREMYENEISNRETDFNSTETITQRVNRTNEVMDTLTDILTGENIELEPELGISYITSVTEQTNEIVAETNAETWQEVSDKIEVLNTILENADNVTGAIVKSIETSANITNITVVQKQSVSVMIVPSLTEHSLRISPSANVEVAISRKAVMSLTQKAGAVLAASVHSGAQECYDDISPNEVDIFSDDTVEMSMSPESSEISFLDITKFQIITEIVSVNIKPKLVNTPITLSFRHVRNITNVKNFTVYCAYIDKKTSRWTNDKCNITSTNRTHTTFTSNHLTNFAILMQFVDFEISKSHQENLSLLTYICLSISVFCLVLSLCIFALVKGVLIEPWSNIRGHRTERYHLHANLALGMLLGQITFLAGSRHPPGSDSCKATAVLLHFFYLTAFSWMLVEGFHLYNLVVKVFRSAQSKLGYYYMIGWGVPLLICAVSFAAAFDGYGENKNCWLDINNSRVIWAFVGPVMFVLLVNTIILIKVTCVISALAKSQDNCIKCMTDRATIAVCVKAVAVLMPILGVTWIFGVLAVNEDLIVFQYIFAVFNSLQGFFLFMFHCVFNSETRASLVYRTKSLRTEIPSKSTANSKGRRATKVRRDHMTPRPAWSDTDRPSRRCSNQDIPSTSRHQSTSTRTSSRNSRDASSSNSNKRKIMTKRVNPNAVGVL